MGNQPASGSGYGSPQSLPPPPLAHAVGVAYDPVRGQFAERRNEPTDRFGPLTNPSLPSVSQHFRGNGNDAAYQQSSLSREVTYVDGSDSRMTSWDTEGPEGGQFTSLGRDDENVGRAPKARTLGGDRARDKNPVPIREIRPIALPVDVETRGETSASGARIRLPIPSLQTLVSAKVEGREGDVFGGKNSEDSSGMSSIQIS